MSVWTRPLLIDARTGRIYARRTSIIPAIQPLDQNIIPLIIPKYEQQYTPEQSLQVLLEYTLVR